mgnify:CR=1 FL=1
MRDAGEPVDYAYISVRNLGAIYEGLLENKLRVVDAAIKRLLAAEGAILAHVCIDPKTNVWPLVPPGETNDVMLEGMSA